MIYTVTLNPTLDRELTVPELVFDQVLRATSQRIDIGGKGFNVSRTLAALAVPSVALGFIGGRTGQALCEGLNALGITTDVVWVNGETRSNISIVAEQRTHHIKVNEPGPSISVAECTTLRERVRALAQRGDWWVLAGNLPPGVPSWFYADLIKDIQSVGGHIILDTSGEALHMSCAAYPTLIKPNATEASALTGQPITTVEEALAAARLLNDIPYVVISLGATGALLVHAGQGWVATPPRIQERNPIGAGDALVAGVVWRLSQHDVPGALAWGVACGAAAASKDGTSVGSYDEVATLMQQVQLRQVL